jgi:hypothetical protein
MKTSERTILRVKDLSEQIAPAPGGIEFGWMYYLLPAGLDRVVIGCNSVQIVEGVLNVYRSLDPLGPVLFSCPVASGYVLIAAGLADTDTVEGTIRRVHEDELEAEKLAAELHAEKPLKTEDNVTYLKPSQLDKSDEKGPFEPPPAAGPGQYL